MDLPELLRGRGKKMTKKKSTQATRKAPCRRAAVREIADAIGHVYDTLPEQKRDEMIVDIAEAALRVATPVRVVFFTPYEIGQWLNRSR